MEDPVQPPGPLLFSKGIYTEGLAIFLISILLAILNPNYKLPSVPEIVRLGQSELWNYCIGRSKCGIFSTINCITSSSDSWSYASLL